MNKIMSRYKGLILSGVSMIMIVVCVCSFSFVSRAQSYSVQMRCNEPSVDELRGYILLYHASGEVNLFYWTVFNVDKSSDVDRNDVSLNIRVNQNSIDFMAGAYGSAYFGMYAFYQGADPSDDRESMEVNTQFVSQYSKSITFGSDIVAYTHRGSYQVVNNTNSWANDVVVSSWGGDTLILQEMDSILTSLHELIWFSNQQYYTLPQVITELQKIVYEVKDLDSMLGQVSQLIDYHGIELKKELGALYVVVEDVSEKLDTLIDEQKKSNSWLEKIWNSIQQFFTPGEKDKEESGKLESETNEKSDKLDDLNEQNKTDKVDVGSASDSVDKNVDLESIGTVNNIFVYITENEYILQMLLMVFSVALVAYVLFGKK